MLRPVRFASALLLAGLFFSSPTSAQSDPAQILQSLQQQSEKYSAQWLASPDPRLRAWGAYAVLRDHQTDQVPTLLSLVAAYEPIPGEPTSLNRDTHDAMLAILDAVIQLNAQVPAADAAKLYPEFPAQSVILLSRSRDNVSSHLLDIFEDQRSGLGAWLAAGDLLASNSALGFAAAVLDSMTIHASVAVTMPGQKPNGQGVAGDKFGNILEPKPGWPEVGTYTLSRCPQTPREGAIVLASGIDTAYYHRHVDSKYDPDAKEDFCFILDRDTFREHLLDRLMNESADNPPLPAVVQVGITWRGSSNYLSRLNGLVAREQAEVHNVIWRLQCSGMLVSGESITGPHIEVRIWDQRPQGSPPLPLIPALPSNTSISAFR